MKPIFVIGAAVIDFIFWIDKFPTKPDKYSTNKVIVTGGGNAANAAVAVARLGHKAQCASRVGNGNVANMIIKRLEAENVDCQFIKKFENCRSPFSSVFIDKTGERQIVSFKDDKIPTDTDWIIEKKPDFSAALADNKWAEGAELIMKYAKEKNVPGVMDVERNAKNAIGAIELASHVAFSAQGAEEFTGCDNPKDATKKADEKIGGRVFVTDGPNGVHTIQDGELVTHPTFEVDVVDTLAAGDVWHGAFTLALAEKQPENDAIRFANATAAIKCTRHGGREGIPNRKEVEEFLGCH